MGWAADSIFWVVFCCGLFRVDGLSLHTEEGEKCHARLYIGSRMLTEHEPHYRSINIPWQGSPMPKIVMMEDGSLGWKLDKTEMFLPYRLNEQLDFHIRNIRDNYHEIMAQYDKTIILCVDAVCGITLVCWYKPLQSGQRTKSKHLIWSLVSEM